MILCRLLRWLDNRYLNLGRPGYRPVFPIFQCFLFINVASFALLLSKQSAGYAALSFIYFFFFQEKGEDINGIFSRL